MWYIAIAKAAKMALCSHLTAFVIWVLFIIVDVLISFTARARASERTTKKKQAKMLLFRVNYNFSPPTHPVNVALGVHLVCGHVRFVYLYASDRN